MLISEFPVFFAAAKYGLGPFAAVLVCNIVQD